MLYKNSGLLHRDAEDTIGLADVVLQSVADYFFEDSAAGNQVQTADVLQSPGVLLIVLLLGRFAVDWIGKILLKNPAGGQQDGRGLRHKPCGLDFVRRDRESPLGLPVILLVQRYPLS